jgi:hypothetical protein
MRRQTSAHTLTPNPPNSAPPRARRHPGSPRPGTQRSHASSCSYAAQSGPPRALSRPASARVSSARTSRSSLALRAIPTASSARAASTSLRAAPYWPYARAHRQPPRDRLALPRQRRGEVRVPGVVEHRPARQQLGRRDPIRRVLGRASPGRCDLSLRACPPGPAAIQPAASPVRPTSPSPAVSAAITASSSGSSGDRHRPAFKARYSPATTAPTSSSARRSPR